MVTVQAAIEVRAIGQRARSGKVTLRDVSMTIGHGELVAIIGGSGSGKTTLLDAMSGLRPPSSGTIHRIQRHIGYVPNADTIHPVLPLARALRYTAALRCVRIRAGDGAVTDALRAVNLEGRAAAPVGQLDAGERKRAAIAAELLAGAAQLFLEEPTIGLDPAHGTEVMRLLRRLCDNGTTVVLTTQNPLDAARCDKVAVLATGGHLAFFGTSADAREYFAADSLDEIYERLAGLGDPAAAWSRRFSHVSRTVAGFTPSLAVPSPPSTDLFAGDIDGGSAGAVEARAGAVDVGPVTVGPGMVDPPVAADDDGGSGPPSERGGQTSADPVMLRPVRQSAVLVGRNADVLARSRLALAALAGAPAVVLLAFLVLLRMGALDTARPGAAFWVVFGGFFVGLAYGLPQIGPEAGVLRAERFAGLNAAAYVLAKVVVLSPVLAAADVVILLVPGIAGRLHGGGYGPAFVTLLLSSAVALALGLLVSAAVSESSSRALAPAATACLPPVLLAAALLTLLDHPIWGNWLALAVLAVAFLTAATALIAGD